MRRVWQPGDLERIEANYAVGDSGCWLWQRPVNSEGYGRIRFGGKTWGAHRASYELYVGPIPEGLVLDHLCRVRHCVNPDHLEPVTDEENRMRGESHAANARRTGRCVNGHEYTEATTYLRSEGGRRCRACSRERTAAQERDQRGLLFTCPVCGQQRHTNGKRRHLLIHEGVTP